VPLISIVPRCATPARGEAGLHVAHAPAVDPSVAHDAAERIDGPSFAGGHHVDVAVQVHDRPGAAASCADHVHAWMPRGVFGQGVGGDVLDLEPAPREIVAEKTGARVVGFARRIDGGDPHQIHRELHELVARAVHFRGDPIDDMHGSAYNTPCAR